MQKIEKITFKILSFKEDLGNSELKFILSGNNINYIVANTIRRTIFSDIPIYAFNEFKFEKNTSIFHNNYLKLRFKNMPIWGIENNIDFLDTEIQKKEDINDDINESIDDGNEIEMNDDSDINISTLKQLTMYINYKNKTNDIVTVSTNDVKFYFEQNQIETPYKIPLPLVKLQPSQEIIVSCISNINTEDFHAMYSAVSTSFYKEINENEFEFNIKSRGQINEIKIVKVAIINIIKKINNIKKLLENNEIDNDVIQGIVILNNEDHTVGNLISRGLQLHENISFAGYNMDHPLVKKVNIHYKLKTKKNNIINIIDDVCNYYITLFTNINKFFK
jgi:DNA-directed RNA polymerase subunit L